MIKLAACLLAVAISAPAMGSEVKALIHVQVRVVHPAKVQLSTSPSEVAPRAVAGGTELRVGVHASVSGRETKNVRLSVDGCDGAHAEWAETSDASGKREVKLFVPTSTQCDPVVVATVEADGAP